MKSTHELKHPVNVVHNSFGRSMFNLQLSLIKALLLIFVSSTACASSIDCSKAKNVAEKTICGSEHGYLVNEDKKLNRAFVKLLEVLPEDQKAIVFAEQKKWLRLRDKCQDDRSCLSERYSERRQAIVAKQRELSAYKPDNTDLEALAQFRMTIEQNMLNDKEFPLENAIEKYSLAKEIFSMGHFCFNSDDLMERPKKVTAEEWAAFSSLATYSESIKNSCPDFSWLDVDGDGQRDLLVRSYASNAFFEAVLKRTGKTFGDVGHVFEDMWQIEDTEEIFSWDCKGCDEDAAWVRINGRVYRAFRNGRFGINEVFLLSPLRVNIEAPRLVVKYGYSLRVVFDSSVTQPLFAYNSQNKRTLQSAITKTLEKLSSQSETPPSQNSSPLCPIPKGTPKQERSKYTRYADGSYPFEAVADFPIWIAKQCHIARLLSMYAYSEKTGIFAQLLVRRSDAEFEFSDSESDSFELSGRRYVVDVDSGLARSGRWAQ
ncbi:MAG: hypothetical protein IV101_12760 [Dechloromonas sp.]|nr:hypothetical protein [Dechloromonas sp.]